MTEATALSAGIPGAAVVELAVAVASVGVVYALYRVIYPVGSITARARAYARQRRDIKRTSGVTTRSRHQKSVGMLRRLLEKLQLTRGEEVRKATDQLAQAGWRSPDALTVFLSLRLAMPVGLGVLAYVLAPFFSSHLTPIARIFIAMIGVTVGAYGPTTVLKNFGKKRQMKIQVGLSDALDLFVICAEAGLSLDAAIGRVAREIGGSAPELADELGLTAIELGFLPNRRDALNNLTKRADIAPIRNLVTTLTQTERYGTPLAQSLRVLASEFRNQRMMRAEEKAARLPATLTVPMIVFIMPPLFCVLIGPAIIQVLAQLHM